ncbi:glycoside hydrolase family 20 protein [Scleroderma citrinum]
MAPRLTLSPSFTFDVAVPNPPADLLQAVTETKSYLDNDKLGRLVVSRGANDSPAIAGAKSLQSLTLSLTEGAQVASISSESVKPFGTRSEEYTLIIPEDGSDAMLTANSTLGLFRGLTTFSQLWYYYNNVTYTIVAPINIVDAPAYPYRGFGLDTSRNLYVLDVPEMVIFHKYDDYSFPVEDLTRTLDAMSWIKLNTFHWHITDSQRFPLEVAEYPELAQNGAYSPQEVYSECDVQYIVSYAAARGIDVLLEIDTPGHTSIIAASYPEYVACFKASPWSTYAAEPPAGQLRFALPEVVNFTASLLSDVAKTLPSKYFSTGGDELNTNCFVNDTATQEHLKATGMTLNGALDAFTNATHGALIAHGKTPVAIIFYATFLVLTRNRVWISADDAVSVAKKGLRIVQVPFDYFYLDCGAGEWLGDSVPLNSWCDPFKTWSKSYTYDPLANLTEAQYHLVLGGEQILWAEQSGPQNLEPIVWPRAASSAEIFWSSKQPSGDALDVTEALPRLHDLRYRMVQRGVNAIPLQPQWCALRPHLCDLDA